MTIRNYKSIKKSFTFRRAAQSELVHVELGESNFFNDWSNLQKVLVRK